MMLRGGRLNWRVWGGRAVLLAGAVLISACAGQGGDSDARSGDNGAKDEPIRVAHFRAPGPRANLTIFSPLSLPAPGEARTIRGEPGPGYWQNRADYTIDATLDAEQRKISATCRVTYTNHSPHALDFLWLSMDQNLYKGDSDGAKLTRPGDRFGNLNFDGGFEVSSVRFENGGAGALEVHDTLARLDLAAPLAPGGSVVFTIGYTFKVPEYGSDRMGIMECRDGDIFQVGQWFPQVCKFDDVSGWNTLPYLGDGEFYTDFGDYRVSITVPGDHVVAATGELMNEDEVLDTPQRGRLSTARSSGEPVVIRSIEEIPDDENAGVIGTKTWRFEATNCRTFGWASSRAFAWDACVLNVEGPDEGGPAAAMPGGAGRSVLCQSFYPRESGSLWDIDGQGGGSTRMLRDSIANYSRRWHRYPYPSATNVAGCVAGMEYPMLVFCKEDEDEHELWGVITHEIGHTWFPMMVNSDERRYAWMDEGFNTFLNTYATADRYEDEPVKHTITEFAHMHPAPLVQAIDTPPDGLAPRMLGVGQYDKPAVGLAMLREAILGPERFDRAFRAYIKRWAFKSPQPADFYRTMEDEAGVDLAWFWRGWFGETGVIDQAVTTVLQAETGGASESRNARVTFRNLGGMVCPVVYLVEYSNGTSERRSLPVEVWSVSDEWQTTWDVQGRRIRRVEVDPDHLFPDVDRSNNIWER